MKSLSESNGESSGGLGRAGSAAAVIFSVLALLQIAYLAMTSWSNSIPTAMQHVKLPQDSYIATNLSTNLSSTSLRKKSSNREVDGTISTFDISKGNVTLPQSAHEVGNQSISMNVVPRDVTPSNINVTTGNHSHIATSANTSNLSSKSLQKSIPRNTSGPPPTLIQQLAGELGNHLGYMMHGFAVKWYAQETFGLDLELLTLHQDHPKWVHGKKDMLRCFPKFQDWNFDRDKTWDQLQERTQQQETWLSEERQEVLDHVSNDPKVGTAFNDSLIAYLEEYTRTDKPNDIEGSEISLPFLRTTGMIHRHFFDKYFDRIREILQFEKSNKSGCCAILPDEDETVFHYRNFATEVPRGVHGLMDFGPNQTARDLFGHLKPGDKVAVITRFDNEKSEEQVNALRARGLQVRLITDQTGVQDFCILLQTKKEVVGLALSTFAFWGSLLGSAQTIRLFVPVGSKLLDHHGSLENVKRNVLYNYTHPDISNRLNISLIPLEE